MNSFPHTSHLNGCRSEWRFWMCSHSVSLRGNVLPQVLHSRHFGLVWPCIIMCVDKFVTDLPHILHVNRCTSPLWIRICRFRSLNSLWHNSHFVWVSSWFFKFVFDGNSLSQNAHLNAFFCSFLHLIFSFDMFSEHKVKSIWQVCNLGWRRYHYHLRPTPICASNNVQKCTNFLLCVQDLKVSFSFQERESQMILTKKYSNPSFQPPPTTMKTWPKTTSSASRMKS